MTLYGIQNDEDRWFILLLKGYFFQTTIPYRQLFEKEKNANQVANKICRKYPQYKNKLKITPVILTAGESSPYVFPVKEEEE